MHIVLPLAAKTEATRFRFWQPVHSGQGADHWAVDEMVVGIYHGMPELLDSFDVSSLYDTNTYSVLFLPTYRFLIKEMYFREEIYMQYILITEYDGNFLHIDLSTFYHKTILKKVAK